MAISDKLTQLRQIRDSIRTAIVNRGGTLPEGTSMESYSDAITNIPGGAKLTGVVRLSYIGSGSSFVSGLESIDYSTVTDMSYMFDGHLGTTVDLSSLDTSNVTNMSNMFINCTSLTHLDLSSFDTSNVTNMSNMFYNCANLTTVYVKDQDAYNKFTTLPSNTPSQVQFIIK